MNDIARSIIAAFVATVVISMVMVLRLAAGIGAEFNPVEIINLSAGALLGTPHSALLAWVFHFLIGTVIWGAVFAVVHDHLPGPNPLRQGAAFGVLAWLAVMVTVYPLAGSGFFALGFGPMAPLMALVTHLIFGAVLGATHGWLRTL